MNELNKVASICASVAKQKIAAVGADDFSRLLQQTVDAKNIYQTGSRQAKEYAKALQGLAGTPDWLKVLLGVGGGTVAINALQDNKSDWRR